MRPLTGYTFELDGLLKAGFYLKYLLAYKISRNVKINIAYIPIFRYEVFSGSFINISCSRTGRSSNLTISRYWLRIRDIVVEKISEVLNAADSNHVQYILLSTP